MKKLILLTLIIFLIACSSPQQPSQETKTPGTKQVTQETLPILSRVNDIPNAEYEYSEPPTDSYIHHVWLKDDRMHIKYAKKEIFKKGVDVTDVYFDLKNKVAKGYCEIKDPGYCTDYNKAVQADFASYYRNTPYEWLKEIKDLNITGSEQIGGRAATVITFKKEGGEVKMWIDDFYKIPVKIQTQSKTITYNIISMGKVQEKDMEHQEIV